ncbi:MAG: formylmethanofuran--tetrahydromethanopterin N-formyltransferase, partial [Gammaproteobacteria bacterium]
MRIQATEIIDTFAEAFEMWAARVIITAETHQWATAAAQSMTGFATSVI